MEDLFANKNGILFYNYEKEFDIHNFNVNFDHQFVCIVKESPISAGYGTRRGLSGGCQA